MTEAALPGVRSFHGWGDFRKETYATTGSRITVHVFAGRDFDEKTVLRPDFGKTG